MKEKNNNIPDMEQLAETGWQQMHEMLMERGMSADIPSVAPSVKKRNWFLLIAATILLFLIFSSPFILNDKYHVASTIQLNSEYSSPSKIEIPSQPEDNRSQQVVDVTTAEQKDILRQKLKADYSKFRKEQVIAQLQDQRTFFIQKFSGEKVTNTTLPKLSERIDTTTHLIPSLTIPKKIKNNVTRKVQFFAGAGINISEGDKNSFSLHNFNIHPGFTVIIPFTQKLSLHTGLWAFSTLHIKEASTKERELVNTINPYYNINTTSIVKASYFDLPLTMHYSINSNWSVGAGLQLSKLYRINIKEKKESYDYNNLLFSSTVNLYNPTPARAAAIFQKKVEVKKYEPRLVIETNFNYHNWLFSAGYYYGTGKTITLKDANNMPHHYRNEYFKCGVQYRIRWNK
jgi:hypothetical protein